MTQQQIVDKQIEEDYDKFYNSAYKGKVEVPKDILDKFKKGVMAMPPFAHKINFLKIKSVATKQIVELTNGDLNEIIKIILSTCPKELYADFKSAVDGNIDFEKFVLCFNDHVESFTKKLQMRKATLMDLSGVSVLNKKLTMVN